MFKTISVSHKNHMVRWRSHSVSVSSVPSVGDKNSVHLYLNTNKFPSNFVSIRMYSLHNKHIKSSLNY